MISCRHEIFNDLRNYITDEVFQRAKIIAYKVNMYISENRSKSEGMKMNKYEKKTTRSSFI